MNDADRDGEGTEPVNADFYVGLGKTARWLGSIADGGAPGDITADYDLFNISADVDPYTEDDFRDMVASIIADAKADDAGFDPADGWPWEHRSSTGTDFTYAFNNGCIHVFENGYMVAQHYPNGARRQSEFPEHLTPVAAFPEGGGE